MSIEPIVAYLGPELPALSATFIYEELLGLERRGVALPPDFLGVRFLHPMIVIRRMVDRRRAYTAIFLPGEAPKIFPTDDAEHARILQVYKQDRPHDGILNDFSELDFPRPSAPATSPAASAPRTAPSPWPLTKSSRRSATKRS